MIFVVAFACFIYGVIAASWIQYELQLEYKYGNIFMMSVLGWFLFPVMIMVDIYHTIRERW